MTEALPADPLAEGGIEGFGERLRQGRITAEAATAAYLGRIAVLDGRLGAYEYVAGEPALAAARAFDALLAAGTDLGPLMGVPVSVKDLFAVEGMPTTVGSNLGLDDLVGPEGSFVKRLKRSGCVVLGKTRLPEFAMGSVGRGGVSHLRGSPWNPWDAETPRSPGGSSSGSAVAVAAGLCAFSIGSDTGGSVRLPAAYCGVFGLKTTAGRWPTDGVFPQSPTLDTIGPLTRSAADAALVFSALAGEPLPTAAPPRALRLAKPVNHFYEDLDPPVEKCVTAALALLADAGAEIVEIAVPEAAEPKRDFGVFPSAELVAVLGRERFLAERHRMDPLIAPRVALALAMKADEYLRLLWRHRRLTRIAAERMAGFDGWVIPTSGLVAPPVAAFANRSFEDLAAEMAARKTHRRLAVNVFGLCATSTPIHALGSDLPIGLQIVCGNGEEAKALSIALLLEDLIGKPPQPDLIAFV